MNYKEIKNSKSKRCNDYPLSEQDLKKIYYTDYIPIASTDKRMLMIEECEWHEKHSSKSLGFNQLHNKNNKEVSN